MIDNNLNQQMYYLEKDIYNKDYTTLSILRYIGEGAGGVSPPAGKIFGKNMFKWFKMVHIWTSIGVLLCPPQFEGGVFLWPPLSEGVMILWPPLPNKFDAPSRR